MASDPAFLFYPGDYLRDTQCLSEKSQVAYDRIMCEHMRNICISQSQLNFFTKKLSDDEKQELEMVLKKTSAGFQISWVAESIEKRRVYSESRSKNRTSKRQKDMNNISSSYVNHMENENENIIEIKNESIIYLMQKVFSDSGLIFTGSNLIDFREIAERILNLKDIAQATDIQKDELINVWTEIVQYCKNNSQFYGSVPAINKHLDKIINSIKHKPTKKGAVKREYYAEDFK